MSKKLKKCLWCEERPVTDQDSNVCEDCLNNWPPKIKKSE